MVKRTARDQEWDRLGARAVQVWGEAAGVGWFLAAVGAFFVVTVAILLAGDDALAAAGLYGIVVTGFGGGCGLIVGMIVGIPLALLVRYGEPRLGPRAVGRWIPVIALTMTTVPFFVAMADVGVR